VNRGGSWNNNPWNCRSANRNRNTPDNRNNNLGFRVALARWKADTSTEQDKVPSLTGENHRVGRTRAARAVLVAATAKIPPARFLA